MPKFVSDCLNVQAKPAYQLEQIVAWTAVAEPELVAVVAFAAMDLPFFGAESHYSETAGRQSDRAKQRRLPTSPLE
jgi:hypothetical protein